MARLGRYFLPDQPLHVIERGNNRDPIFYCPDDHVRYRAWLAAAADDHGCPIHAYVLMTNHVHLPLRYCVCLRRICATAITRVSTSRRAGRRLLRGHGKSLNLGSVPVKAGTAGRHLLPHGSLQPEIARQGEGRLIIGANRAVTRLTRPRESVYSVN